MSVVSGAFARMRGDVLAIVGATPRGRLITFADIGRWLDVMPRHTAFLLNRLTAEEAAIVPWHRAVGSEGRLGRAKVDRLGRTQVERLAEEGLRVADGRVLGFVDAVVSVASLNHGVPRGTAPPGATGWRGVRA